MICPHKNRAETCNFDGAPLYKCNECGLVFTDKYGKNFDPRAVYENFYRNEIAGRFGFGVEYVIRLFRFFRAFKIFTIYPRAETILDIGSGRGFTLYYLKKYYNYKRAAGTQVSKIALEFSRNKLGLEIYDKDLPELPLDSSSFDIVTMWHVLEHVSHPEKYIEKISRILKNNGKLIIEAPNFNSWTRPLTDKYWLGLDLERHITFFTPRSLSALLEKYGFEVKKIRTFSLEYSIFISAQSMVSRLTGTNHLFFQWLQTPSFNPRMAIHAVLFLLLMPLCFFVNIILYHSKKGEVLLVIAEKRI